MELTIQKDQANQRCDRFLRKFCKAYPQVRLSDIYQRIRKGTITVNWKKTKEEYRIIEWDIINLPEECLWKKDRQFLHKKKKNSKN